MSNEVSSAQQFFTEGFAVNDSWTYFVVAGKTSSITVEDNLKVQLYTCSSWLTFGPGAENLWVYVTNDPYEYDDVRDEARIINREVNNNNVSVIFCYTDNGGYEFRIANYWLYWKYAAVVNSNNEVGYGLVYNGVSR